MLRGLLWFLSVLLATSAAAEDSPWRRFSSQDGKSFEGRVVNVVDDEAVIERKDKQCFTVSLERFGEADRAYLRAWRPGKAGASNAARPSPDAKNDSPEVEPAPASGASAGSAPEKLYPRTREEIRAELDAIMARKAKGGVEAKQQAALNELNAYRYLCGVPWNVESEPAYIRKAERAALACSKAGRLSHDLGEFTAECSLSSGDDMVLALAGFMEDGGEHNRTHRGHRAVCLNPNMGKTGFGSAPGFTAMWARDQAGKLAKGSWSYPGRGFFPASHMRGNAWSFYPGRPVPAARDVTVEVHRLSARPTRNFGLTSAVPGKRLEVPYVSTSTDYQCIVFEIEGLQETGIYWVRVRGPGVRESYVVELYR